MAGRKPFFLTGANAKILINNKTVAFATDISYTVTVRHASPRVLGRYEVEVHEPLSYDVVGTMTLIRYARGMKDFMEGAAPGDVSNKGNGTGSLGNGSMLGAVGSALGLPTADGVFDGKADEALNPQRFFQSKMFNIEIRQKLPKDQDSGQNFLQQLDDFLVPDILSSSKSNAADNETTIVLLRDCRIEEMDFKLSKRGVAMQTLKFKARYADDDTLIAGKSGVGQQLS